MKEIKKRFTTKRKAANPGKNIASAPPLRYNEEKAGGASYGRRLDDAVKLIKSSEERRAEYMMLMVRDMEMREEGRREGLVKGKILGMIETLRDEDLDEAQIRERIVRKFRLTPAQADQYLAEEDGGMDRDL